MPRPPQRSDTFVFTGEITSTGSRKTQPHERNDYLYTVDELEPWVDRVKEVAVKVKDTYQVTDNHYLVKQQVNALEISSILKGKQVLAPQTLVAKYPELDGFVRSNTRQ